MNSEVNLNDERLPRPARQLTHFLAQELLYEYMLGTLDADRMISMRDYLRAHPELQKDLESMQAAAEYTGTLAKTRLSKPALQEYEKVQPFSQIAVDKMRWKNWPDLAKWSTEAFAVSLIVVVVALMVPWKKFDFSLPKPDTQVTLAKINPPTDAPTPAPTAAPAPAAAPLPTPAPAVATRAAPMEDEAVVANPNAAAADAAASQQKVIPLKGSLYRMMMTIDSADAASATMRDKILAMGGDKAGQVELGWRKKNPDGNYFHFSLPEASYQQLITTLGEYGPVRIYKNPHERVMPEGQIRIILWIEDKTPQTQKNEE